MRSPEFAPVLDPDDFVSCRSEHELPRRLDRVLARSDQWTYRASKGFEVSIPGTVVDRLVAFGRRADPDEWYALLLGRLCEDDIGRHVVVEGAVFDSGARTSHARVETTTESEIRTRRLATLQYPGSIPIGWSHGHVRCGAQYSRVDRDNQRTWTQPHSIGIVVDPWDPKILAVYRGPDAEKLMRVVDDVGTLDLTQPPLAEPAVENCARSRLFLRVWRWGRSRTRRFEETICNSIVGISWLALCVLTWLAFVRAARTDRRLQTVEREVRALYERHDASVASPSGSAPAPASSAPDPERDASVGP